MIVTGSRVFFVRGQSPLNATAATPEQPSTDLNFAIRSARPGVPGVNDPGDRLTLHRDWTFNFSNPDQGFSGIRWNQSWIRTEYDETVWQHANADIYRIQRKGTVGADLQTLVFTCSPNTHAIPAGDPVVIWDATNDTDVVQNTSHSLSGFALPTRTKLAISSCTPSAIYDENGRRIIEINFGTNLPAIDHVPAWFAVPGGGQKSSMQLRHWKFYANETLKEFRHPLKALAQITKTNALPNNGYIILGGNKFYPNGYDWSKDFINFGASLTEELFRSEMQGLAAEFGATDPRRLAVELEDRVYQSWLADGDFPGYKTLLADIFYPVARTAWGQERTLIVKGPGGMAGLGAFDWRPPTGQNVHFAVHVNDTDTPMTNITETDDAAELIKDKINSLGFRGGGITSLTINPPIDIFEKGRRLGRMLTSATNNGLYVFYYASLGTDPATTVSVADVFTINGARIEAVNQEMASLASRSGQVFQ